jgi:hypothetical protein
MKLKTRILQILGVAAIVTMGMTSCDTDACADVECGEYGTCLDGDCVCDAYYEGVNCDGLFVTKFITTNSDVSEAVTYADATTATITYTSSITANGTNKIDITNLGSFGATNVVTCDLDPEDSSKFTIADTDVAARVFAGTGEINNAGTSITITYTVTYSDNTSDAGVATITL